VDAFLAPVPPASFGLDAPATPPRAIPRARVDDAPPTPPLTPEDDGPLAETRAPAPAADDAFDFLSTLFPKDGLRALPHARKVSIAAPELGAAFEGVVLALPGEPKTFYVDGKSAASVNLRERYVTRKSFRWRSRWWASSIVALLDLADEQLECTALVITLERSSPALGGLLHALMYVGGTVVTKPPFEVDPAFVLVGLEL
jgi:hypothetical protein